MPCTVRKTVKAVREMPSTHLMTLANSCEKLRRRSSAFMPPAMCSTQMSEASGKTTPETTPTMTSLRQSTAGW